MQTKLTNGVKVSLMPTKQFKTTRMTISFMTKLASPTQLTKRTLLAYLLELGCEKYPTQQALAGELSEMYGANFGTSTYVEGNLHIVKFNFNCVNGHYLKTKEDLLSQALNLLKEVIFSPLVKGNAFDQTLFKRQQANLQSHLQSLQDDKKNYALFKLRELYFTDPLQQVPLLGSLKELQALTSEELYAYYHQMLAEDEIHIAILGDIDQAKVLDQLAALPFSKRRAQTLNPYYHQPVQPTVIKEKEVEKNNQSKLDLAFHFPFKHDDPLFYAAVVFNSLFGDDSQSFLFQNVREKASLAYYINSNFDPFTQLLYLQTGIEVQNQQQVEDLILQQLAAIQQGDFTEQLLNEIKLGLINDYLSSLDNQSVLVTRSLFRTLLNRELQPGQWLDKIKAVTKEDIMVVAKQVKLQAIYCLAGEKG